MFATITLASSGDRTMTNTPKNIPFDLPTEVLILFRKIEGQVVAHNLHFDLASAGDSREEATRKIKACTKAYVEYGLEKGLEDFIHRPADREYWDLANHAPKLDSDEVIWIDDRRKKGRCDPARILIIPREAEFTSIAA